MEHKIRGRSIRLFLPEGTPTGLLIAEIVNWTGKAVVVPRPALADFLRRTESSATGVYILLGQDPEDLGRQMVYVGEAEEVGSRLRLHDKDEAKDFFERAIVFISKDDNLTKAHARYLEARIVERVKLAARAKCTNGTQPGGSSLPEADVSDMEGYLEQIALILPVLGSDMLRPAPSATVRQIHVDLTADDSSSLSPEFYYRGDGFDAQAQVISDEFVVKRGSLIRIKDTPTCPENSRRRRKASVNEGLLSIKGSGKSWEAAQGIVFKTPSGAASFVYGGSASGNLYWKTDRGESYGDWRATQLAAASLESPVQV